MKFADENIYFDLVGLGIDKIKSSEIPVQNY